MLSCSETSVSLKTNITKEHREQILIDIDYNHSGFMGTQWLDPGLEIPNEFVLKRI